MNRLETNVIQIARDKETRQLWTWVPFPPLDIVRECLKARSCAGCHGAVGPFLFIGKLPNGPYMAFRRPIQLVRNGTLGLVITPKQEPAPAPTPVPAPPLTDTPPGSPISRIVYRQRKKTTKKATKKATKKLVAKTTKKAPKKQTRAAVKSVKKAAKKTVKKTPARRRKP